MVVLPKETEIALMPPPTEEIPGEIEGAVRIFHVAGCKPRSNGNIHPSARQRFEDQACVGCRRYRDKIAKKTYPGAEATHVQQSRFLVPPWTGRISVADVPLRLRIALPRRIL